MKRIYSIALEVEEKSLASSTDEKVTELGMVLQIWQDLKRMEETSSLQQEDSLIKDVLTQVLLSEFSSEDKIPYPDYYSRDEPQNDSD